MQKYAHRCTRHTVPKSLFHFIFAFLPNLWQSLPESRLSVSVPAFTNRKWDGNQARHKPETDSRSQLEYFYKSFAGKSPNFAITGIPDFSKKHPDLRKTYGANWIYGKLASLQFFTDPPRNEKFLKLTTCNEAEHFPGGSGGIWISSLERLRTLLERAAAMDFQNPCQVIQHIANCLTNTLAEKCAGVFIFLFSLRKKRYSYTINPTVASNLPAENSIVVLWRTF